MAGGIAEKGHRRENVLQRFRLERNDPRVGFQASRGGIDDFIRDGADRAELLRDDEIGLQLLE
ncbi:MAG TPA: hypothetical protein VFF63_04830 [Candidatus Babeliales bacterium]|nr:hypothetical protein [Candidatus Babeliales bacterium]